MSIRPTSADARATLAFDTDYCDRVDAAFCAVQLKAVGYTSVLLCLPEHAPNPAELQTVFNWFGLDCTASRIEASKSYHLDAPVTRQAKFALSLPYTLVRTEENTFAASAGAPSYFTLFHTAPGSPVRPTVLFGRSGQVSQLEGGLFPESADDLAAIERETEVARRSPSLAGDSMAAAALSRALETRVLSPDLAETALPNAIAPDAPVIWAPGCGDADLAISSIIASGRTHVVLVETPYGSASDFAQAREKAHAGGLRCELVSAPSFEDMTTLIEDRKGVLLSVRDMPALDPLAAALQAKRIRIVAGVGPGLAEPTAIPSGISAAISHPNKLGQALREPDVAPAWPRPPQLLPPPRQPQRTEMTSITVIIATHARPDMLEQALASLDESQKGLSEVIVIDDGSPEPDAERNRALCVDFQRFAIRYERTDNLYPGHARNYGASLATSDWLYFLDDDNTLRSGAIESLKTIQSDTGAEAVFSHMRIMGEVPDARFATIPFFGPVGPASIFQNSVADTGFAISKRAFERVGGFPETYGVGKEDYAMALRLMRADVHWTLCVQTLYNYRIHDNRIRKKHRTRAANSFLPLSTVLPVLDHEGRLNRTGGLERLAFMQAERLSLRHVPDRKHLRSSPWAVFVHHVLRPFMRSNRAVRSAVTGDDVVGRLIRTVFFRRRG